MRPCSAPSHDRILGPCVAHPAPVEVDDGSPDEQISSDAEPVRSTRKRRRRVQALEVMGWMETGARDGDVGAQASASTDAWTAQLSDAVLVNDPIGQ